MNKYMELYLHIMGLIQAISGTIGCMVYIFLNSSLGIPLMPILLLAVSVIIVSYIAAMIFPVLIEKRTKSLSVSAGTFVGMLSIIPLCFSVCNAFNVNMKFWVFCASVVASSAIAYCIGEGIGRLACISFGCCYGKPINQCNKYLQIIFNNIFVVFSGETKKAVYDGHLKNEKLIPVQFMSSIILFFIGLISIVWFFYGKILLSFMISAIGSQSWRFLSEFLRQDYRGDYQKISTYQVFSLISIIFSVILFLIIRLNISMPLYPNLNQGLLSLIPAIPILLVIFLLIFYFTGKSKVISATLKFKLDNN